MTPAEDDEDRKLREAQDALRESNERLQLALEAGHLGDWTWNAASDEVSLGRRAADIFGFPDEHVETWTALRERLHEDDRERARIAVEAALANHADYNVEYRVLLPSRQYRWVEAYGRGTYGSDGAVTGMTGIVQDITSRKRLLESERAARAAAERMSEMKDQFLATLSHELRTPLSAILGWSQVLRRGAKNGGDVERGLETIERNARMQTKLIEDLLDMSRIASGKVRLDLQPVHPAAFIEAAVDTVRPAADAKGIALDWTVGASVGPIPGDAARLQQVVWNLLSNAIKFTPRDGRIEIAVRRESFHVEIRVTDSGIGIRPEFLAHLFERFRQADASTTRKYGGLGLGLSIVKNLVELHGGSVFAQSDGEGRGSAFIVYLPAPSADAGEPLRDRVAPILESLEFRSLDLSGVKVLLVDDDADSRELALQVLSDCGAEVLSAASASQALELVQAHLPHVVVSDIGMPDVDGIELLRRIRDLGEARGGNTPAIALTAFARAEDRRRALDAGYSVHLAKPVESAKLIATVAAVAGRETRASSRAPQML